MAVLESGRLVGLVSIERVLAADPNAIVEGIMDPDPPKVAPETIIDGIGGFATGRFSTPEEVATLITLLASERTANITGRTTSPTAA